jgi:hypothetical protein
VTVAPATVLAKKTTISIRCGFPERWTNCGAGADQVVLRLEAEARLRLLLVGDGVIHSEKRVILAERD